MRFPDFDSTTRTYMLDEFEQDEKADAVYYSDRLSGPGRAAYSSLFRRAIMFGGPDHLVSALEAPRMMATAEQSTRNGRVTTRRVPHNAPTVLAQGEFNRYYMRALCRQALEDRHGALSVEVSRFRSVTDPRPESDRRIGTQVNPATVLAFLRRVPGQDNPAGPDYGWLTRPNSGLSLRLVHHAPTIPASANEHTIRLVDHAGVEQATVTILAEGPVHISVDAGSGTNQPLTVGTAGGPVLRVAG